MAIAVKLEKMYYCLHYYYFQFQWYWCIIINKKKPHLVNDAMLTPSAAYFWRYSMICELWFLATSIWQTNKAIYGVHPLQHMLNIMLNKFNMLNSLLDDPDFYEWKQVDYAIVE